MGVSDMKSLRGGPRGAVWMLSGANQKKTEPPSKSKGGDGGAPMAFGRQPKENRTSKQEPGGP